MNRVAPALVEGTAMLCGILEELARGGFLYKAGGWVWEVRLGLADGE